MIIGCLGALVTSTLFILCPIRSHLAMQLLLFFFGLFSAGFLPAFALARELCNQNYVATALSFMNMMNMVGIALVQPAVGFVLDHLWTGDMTSGVRIYPVSAYHTALAILPIGIFVALLLLPMLNETYCKPLEDRS